MSGLGSALGMTHTVRWGLLHLSPVLGRVRFLRLAIPRHSPFKPRRFPRATILCAVRWCLRFPLSSQGVVDLLSEPGIEVDRSTTDMAHISTASGVSTERGATIRSKAITRP
jgi:hypothetical protein